MNERAVTPESEFRWVDIKSVDELEVFYRSILPVVREAAKAHGYAIGLHGSMRRDLDLIAVPWIEEHSTKDVLAEAIHIAACGLSSTSYPWEVKPCGRFATAFPVCWIDWDHPHRPSEGHIDLSVIGLAEAKEKQG